MPVSDINRDPMQTGLIANRDGRQDVATLDLGPIADQLNAIAATLRGDTAGQALLQRSSNNEIGPDLRERLRNSRSTLTPRVDLDQRRKRYAEFAREAYATRRRRSAIFENDELFGEPAWDILLDLYIAHVESKAVSVSSACIGSAAPPTTGLRWLGVLSEQNLIIREHDPDDQRRVLVRLTERGLEAMDRYFASAGPTV